MGGRVVGRGGEPREGGVWGKVSHRRVVGCATGRKMVSVGESKLWRRGWHMGGASHGGRVVPERKQAIGRRVAGRGKQAVGGGQV